jgi:type IV pilus assembly protein PilC
MLVALATIMSSPDIMEIYSKYADILLIGSTIAMLIIFGVLPFFLPRAGFILGILFSVVLAAFSVTYGSVELFVVSIVVFLLSMTVTAFGPRRDEALWARIWARRILGACGLIVFGIAGFAFFGRGGSFGLFFVLLFMGAVVGAFATSNLARAAFVITTIGSSMRQNLPLPMALEMAAAGRIDKRARILREIKKWLVEGYPLSEAMKRGYPRCPAYITSLITGAERIGQVPQAIAALEQDLVAKATTSKKVRHIPLMYPPLVLFILFAILSFLMVYIIPRFVEVLKDLDVTGVTTIPPATKLLINIAGYFRSDAATLLGLLLVLLLPIGGIIYIRVRSRPRRPDKPYLISRINDFIKWHIPFLRFYEWSRSIQRVTGMLRLSLNAGCTVNEAIANTLRLDVNECFRRGLKQWLTMVEKGDDIGQSAEKCDLGSGLNWAFCEIGNHTNTLAVLDALEASYRWAFSRSAALARFIIGPCETVCLGLIVGFVVYAVFEAPVAMIYAMASFIP